MQKAHDWTLVTSCFTCHFTVEQLLCSLSAQDRQDFEALIHSQQYAPGCALFREGENARGIYMVTQGTAQLVITDRTQPKRYIRSVMPSEVLGLSATIARLPYEVTAETLTTCTVAFVAYEAFLRFLQGKAHACYQVTRFLGRNLSALYRQVHARAKASSVIERVAGFLLDQCAQGGGEAAETVCLRLDWRHKDIAQLLGVSRESVSRAFGQFRNHKIVTAADTAHTFICQTAALEALVQSGIWPPLTR